MRKECFLIILSILIIAGGCGKDEKSASKSIDQLHKEKGVPVKVQEVIQQPFSRTLSYSGRLSGIRQSTEQSLVSGEVKKIYFNEGDRVNEGDLVISFPKDLPGANYQAAQANYEVRRLAYERLQNLLSEGGIAQQEVDNARAGFLAAESQLDAVQQMLYVRAPISGYVTSVYVQETDRVAPGDLLFTVSKLSRLKSVIDVTEKEISLFRKGTKATAHWEGQDYSGEVTSVGYAMNDRTGAFEAELEFANPERWMKFNINAQIEVEVYNNPQAVVVEKQHLLSDSGGDYVFVESGGRAHKRYLELGKASGLSFEVLEGLQAGDQLVVEGKTLLEDGSKLRINGAGESN